MFPKQYKAPLIHMWLVLLMMLESRVSARHQLDKKQLIDELRGEDLSLEWWLQLALFPEPYVSSFQHCMTDPCSSCLHSPLLRLPVPSSL